MKAKLLVVEDDDQLNEMVVTILSQYGYKVDSAENVNDALAFIKNSQYDIVLTDKNMEGLNGNIEGGMDVLKSVKQISESTDVIMMTGYATIETAIEAMQLGAFDYIKKPFKVDDLLAKIDRIVEYRKILKNVNERLTYKTLHNEILDLIKKEKNVKNEDLHVFLKNIDEKIDLYFKSHKNWNLSWFDVSGGKRRD